MPRTALFTLPLLAALALAWPAAARPAAAQISAGAPGWHPAPLVVAQKTRYARSRGRKIACTPAGCHPIPPGCYPEPAFDFWGNPTGYDKIVCPGR